MKSESKKNRTNLFIEVDLLKKLDHIAGMQYAIKGTQASRTDIVNEALAEYVIKWEKKNGVIPLK
jgi:hypothetical protein